MLVRDEAAIHLWGATDEEWRTRADLASRPISSGAESFLGGTASCRIEVADLDGLFAELRRADVLHAASHDGVTTTDFGSREFSTVDRDGNLLTFYRFDQDRAGRSEDVRRGRS